MIKNLSLKWKLKQVKKIIDSLPSNLYVSKICTLETDKSEPYLDVLFIGESERRFDNKKRKYWEVRMHLTANRWSNCIWYKGYGLSSGVDGDSEAHTIMGVFYKRWETWSDFANGFNPKLYTWNLQEPGILEKWLFREEMKDIMHKIENPNTPLKTRDGWR